MKELRKLLCLLLADGALPRQNLGDSALRPDDRPEAVRLQAPLFQEEGHHLIVLGPGPRGIRRSFIIADQVRQKVKESVLFEGAIVPKRRDALFIAAGVEHREAANEGNRRESPSRFAWIAPFCGLDGIGPVPHLRFGTRCSFDELSNPLFGYDPQCIRFPRREPDGQLRPACFVLVPGSGPMDAKIRRPVADRMFSATNSPQILTSTPPLSATFIFDDG